MLTENEVEEIAKQRASDRLDGDEYPRVPSPASSSPRGKIDQVVASEVSRISRSVRDFSATVERIVDENDVGLHILDMGIALDPNDSDHFTSAFLTATFTELETEIKRENVREGIVAARDQGKWHGRPPFGFDVGAEGYLVPNDDYEKAVVALDELDKGTSKRSLARSLGISRSTVRKIAENRERYTTE